VICSDCPGGTDWEDRATKAEAALAEATAAYIEQVELTEKLADRVNALEAAARETP